MPFIILGLLAMVFGICKWIYQLLFQRAPKHRAEQAPELQPFPIPVRQLRPKNMPAHYQYQETGVAGDYQKTYWGEPMYDEITKALKSL